MPVKKKPAKGLRKTGVQVEESVYNRIVQGVGPRNISSFVRRAVTAEMKKAIPAKQDFKRLTVFINHEDHKKIVKLLGPWKVSEFIRGVVTRASQKL